MGTQVLGQLNANTVLSLPRTLKILSKLLFVCDFFRFSEKLNMENC